MSLEIKDLSVSIEEKNVLNGINLEVKPGEVHALMGPNGSGKTSLAFTIAGHPRYKINKGQIFLNGKEISNIKPHERSKEGIFLGFQHPVEVEGITASHFLYQIAKIKDKEINPVEFRKGLLEKIKLIGVDESFLNRHLNVGLSGGEKKKLEILQMLIIKPKIAILDEPDSGTDVDALKKIAEAIKLTAKEENIGIILITHYNKILEYINPDKVHVILNGNIVREGEFELAQEIEVKGYENYNNK